MKAMSGGWQVLQGGKRTARTTSNDGIPVWSLAATRKRKEMTAGWTQGILKEKGKRDKLKEWILLS